MPETENSQDRRYKSAIRVLEMLDRWSEHLDGRSAQRRAYPRKLYRSIVSIYVNDDDPVDGECDASVAFDAWARNISCAGMSFIYDRQIKRDKLIVCLKNGKRPM